MSNYLEIDYSVLRSNDVLLTSLEDFSFRSKFLCSINADLLNSYYGVDDLTESIMDLDPKFQFCYVNLITMIPEFVVVSVISLKGYPVYLVFKFNKDLNCCEVNYQNGYINKIDTEYYDTHKVPDNIANKIIEKIRGKRIRSIKGMDFLSNYNYQSNIISFKVKDDKTILLAKMLFNKLQKENEKEETDLNNIDVIHFSMSALKLEEPKISKVYLKANEYYYNVYLESGCDVENIRKMNDFEYESNAILDVLTPLAVESFVSEHEYLLDVVEAKKVRDSLFSYFNNVKEIKYVIMDNEIFLEDYPNTPFLDIKDKLIIHSSRNKNEDKPIEINIDSNVVVELKKVIAEYRRSFTHSETDIYRNYIKDAKKFLSDELNFLEKKKLGESLLKERLNEVDKIDQKRGEFKGILQNINDLYSQFESLDNKKISSVLEKLELLKSEQVYIDKGEDLFDAIDELSDIEQLSIKDKITGFDNLIKSLNDYSPNLKAVRRVYISKTVLKELKDIDSKNKELDLLNILDKVVVSLKTLPGDKLGSYLFSKGLNLPIKADRSIKKIRIIRKQPYRILFLYGSDFLGKGSENADSIYLFAMSEHDKDKGDLYKTPLSKPTKYEINRFIIYPVKDKLIKIPECSNEQFSISKVHDNKPVITFGCAGSGKTTVSIEQYVNIVWEDYHSNSPGPDKVVYITYHTGLCNNAKKFLGEYSVEGNCYVLYDYFARILGVELDKSKLLNESLFVNWFENEFIDNSKKFKKSNILTPFKNKSDLARLVYTYYRGVYRGSKELLNFSLPHLTHNLFMEEMKEESYLNSDEKDSIFKICDAFFEYTQKEHIIGDNELAIDVVRQRFALDEDKLTECIIIDEVQDLTEIELIAIVSTLKKDSNKIYFYGDPHQSINPNLFDSGTINKVYTALGKKQSAAENKPLTFTYRTNRNLISYLKELEAYRDKWIGATKGSVNTIDALCEEDSETAWAGYITDKNLYADTLKITSSNCMIITPSQKEKDDLLVRYPEVDETRVITIYEAKGMEWDNVILYNIFTDYNSYFTDMITQNGKAKKSTIHRMTFNKYYVACTRSLKSFVLIEENQQLLSDENLIFNALLKGFSPITSSKSVDTFIQEDNTFDGWYREAIQNLDNDNSAGFTNALEHARKLAVTSEQKELVAKIALNDIDILKEIGIQYLNEGKYESASHVFSKCAKNKRDQFINYRRLCTLLSGNPQHYNINVLELAKDTELIEKYPQILPIIIRNKDFVKRFRNSQNILKNMSRKKDK